jgi:hypothetical protein
MARFWERLGTACLALVLLSLVVSGQTNVSTPFPAKLTDGTNVAAIKAGSTSVSASDPALAVGLSPNNLGCAGASVANTQVAVVNTAANAQVIAGVAAQQTYICGIFLTSSLSQTIALVEGTGAVCGTGTTGMAGGATAALGWSFGTALIPSTVGVGTHLVAKTATAGDSVCLLISGTGQVSGTVVYAQF